MILPDCNEYKKIIAKNLKLYRDKKYTQAQLAEMIQLTENSISDVETEKSIMNSYNLLKVCIVLNITPNDLVKDLLPDKKRLVIDNLLDELSTLSFEEQDKVLRIIQILKSKK